MLTRQRYLSNMGYFICLILAIGGYYFSISEPLFAWFNPDEVILSQTYHNLHGLIACTVYYYLHTTVNRLAADFNGCLMAKNATLFSLLKGWVFNRLVVYFLIPVSIAFLLKETIRVSFKLSFIVALIISSIALFILSNDKFYMHGFDLAIYGMATVSFFVLVALLFKSVKSGWCFLWFCIVYAANLMGHEIFLVISGFFIPLYAWYHYDFNTVEKKSFYLFIRDALRNKRVWVLLGIYFLSALVTTLAPGVGLRQHIWPSTGTFSDGFAHMLLCFEEAIYFIARSYFFVILVFLLGVVFRWFSRNASFFKHKPLYIFLFSAPLVYFLFMGFLTGLSPTLWGGAFRTEAFRWFEPFLSPIVSNQKILSQGWLFVSRTLFFYLSIFLNIFLLGFLVTGNFKKYIKKLAVKRSWPRGVALFSVVMLIFLFHPDGVGSLRILPALFKHHVDLTNYAPKKHQEAQREMSLIELLQSRTLSSRGLTAGSRKNEVLLDPAVKPRDGGIRAGYAVIHAMSDMLFPRGRLAKHEADIANIRVNDYMYMRRGEVVSPKDVGLIYDLMIPGYSHVIKRPEYQNEIYALYHVFLKEPCVSFSGGLQEEPEGNATCFNTFGKKNIAQWLAHRKVMAPVPIHFSQTEGVDIKKQGSHCMQVSDIASRGEHFIRSNEIQLSKGLYYFIFETKPTKTKLNLYIIGEKRKLLLSWLNAPVSWGKFGQNDSLQPIFSQVVSGSKLEKLRVVIYSAMDQKIYLRWQHGDIDSASTIYQGKKHNASRICEAGFGRIVKEY